MRILLFGATGMVGQGILRECLMAPDVTQVLSVGRSAMGIDDDKLQELTLPDLFAIDSIAEWLSGFDACFYSLGVSAIGMKEAEYRRITYDLAMTVAQAVLRASPQATFVYVSGQGTNARNRAMWSRVKGSLENSLLRMPFAATYMFRPGLIRPLHGIKSRTKLYNVIYPLLSPLMPLATRLFPRQIVTTEEVGQAMLSVARQGFRKRILEVADIRRAAGIPI